MRDRVILTLMLIGALLPTLPALAQDQQRPGPTIIDRQLAGQGNQNPYFTPTPQPFQGSFARRWQEKLEQMYGGVEAGRGVPPPDNSPVFLPQPYDLIFVHPKYRDRCGRLGRYRIWQWQRNCPGASWYDWYRRPPLR